MLEPMSETSRPTLRTRATRRRLHGLVAVLTAACLVLAGCGGDDKKADGKEERPKSQPTQGGSTLAAVWPLTGRPAPSETPDHPVMVVKIDNTSNSSPQVGLGKADMVVEELVEGGMTRLAVMFHSQLPKVAGPVRSMRASDIGVVKPTHAVLVASGAAPPTYDRLAKAKVRHYTGGPGYFRDGGRHAPYNLMVNLPDLAGTIKGKPVVPANYLPWGSKKDFSGTGKANRIDVRFSPATTTSFEYKAKKAKYDAVNSYAGKGDRFDADSVLVLRVRQGDAGYLDPAGSKVPETLFFGKGKALLFHKGQVVRASWSKKKRDSPLELRTKAGKLKMPPGNVWVELLPNPGDGGSISWK